MYEQFVFVSQADDVVPESYGGDCDQSREEIENGFLVNGFDVRHSVSAYGALYAPDQKVGDQHTRQERHAPEPRNLLRMDLTRIRRIEDALSFGD